MTIPDDSSDTPIAEELRGYADEVAQLSEEIERIERETTADEISYQLREGEVAIVKLTYQLADGGAD